MAERKKYLPGRKGGTVNLHRRTTDKDGNVKVLYPIVIPPEGLVTDDKEIQKFLDENTLKGHRSGFIEVDLPGVQAKEDKAKATRETPHPNDPAADNDFQALPDDAKFPYHYGGGWWFLSNGERFQGKKAEAVKEEKAQAKKTTAKKEEPEQEEEKEKPEPKVVEEVKNLNNLRDWLGENTDMEVESLTTKEEIENAASELDPPVEFPNYNS